MPAPAQPPAADLEKINSAIKALLVKDHPELKNIFEQYPAYNPVPEQLPFGAAGFPVIKGDPPTAMQLIAAGWVYVLIDPAYIQADNAEGLTKGIIGLVNKGHPRKPEDWGALRAWSWGGGTGVRLSGDRTRC